MCDTEYIEGQIENCSTCGYDLTPYPLVLGQIPAAFLEKEQKRIAWAKRLWKTTRARLAKAAQKVKQAEIRQARLDNQTILARIEELSQNQIKFQSELQGVAQNMDAATLKTDNFAENLLSEISEMKQEIASLKSISAKVEPEEAVANVEKQLDETVSPRYQKLEQLLAAGKWQEADKETVWVMLQVAGREKEGWLNSDSIQKFPCEDLRQIDRLWVKYSNGRFGFSVQKRIWEEVGGHPGANYETKRRVGDRVGWRVGGKWKNYSELTFSPSAPVGHLPSHPRWGADDRRFAPGSGVWRHLLSLLD